MSRELSVVLGGTYYHKATIKVPSHVDEAWLNENIKSKLKYCNDGGTLDLEYLGNNNFEILFEDMDVLVECETEFSVPGTMDIRLIEDKSRCIGSISYSDENSCEITTGENELTSNGVFSINWGALNE